MKTEAHLEPTAVFIQRVTAAVSELKVEIGSLFTYVCISPHNIAAHFLQYISGDPNQRRPKQ
ncbi:MAG TPA: hypothetical protein VFH87_11685 [Candidatus Udaeobacter sp.]|nr:hypothetical protein [Candidatus Udaeobacter sp.]